MPNFCSSMILQWVGDRWSEFHFEPGTANARRQRLISLDQVTVDYGFQKRLLDELHLKQGLDIYVSGVLVLQKQDKEAPVVTLTTLASGTTGTLLPHAERLSFGKQTIDPGTGLVQKGSDDIADVAWSEAMAIVGHLFEPVPYLYPPRFRALGFPDADAWPKLKAQTRPN